MMFGPRTSPGFTVAKGGMSGLDKKKVKEHLSSHCNDILPSVV